MNANVQKPQMVSLTAEKYQALLEGHFELSLECSRLKNQLQSEYNFAEDKLQALQALTVERDLMKAFIDSDKDIAEKFEAFKVAAAAEAEVVEEAEEEVEG